MGNGLQESIADYRGLSLSAAYTLSAALDAAGAHSQSAVPGAMASTGRMPPYVPTRKHVERALIPDVSHGLYVRCSLLRGLAAYSRC